MIGMSRRLRRSRHYARAAAYVDRHLRRLGGTALDVAIARAIVYSCGVDVYRVATRTLQDRARDWIGASGRYADRPSYGAVAQVLEWLRALGYVGWTRAYVHRWHRHLDPELRRAWEHPVRTPTGEYRHRARRIYVLGMLREYRPPVLGCASGRDRVVSWSRPRAGPIEASGDTTRP